MTPLESIAEIRSSNVDKKAITGEQSVRLCNYMDVYSNRYITEDIVFMEASATTVEIQRFGIERGDVLITKDSETPNDIGVPAVVIQDISNLVCGYHVALLKLNRAEVDPIYLAKQLGHADTARYFGRVANGSTRYGLSYKSLAQTPIRLAPLAQQKHIAEILVTVDEAIKQTKALIAKTQQIKAGLLHDLFTRGVTADGQLRPPHEDAPQLYKESEVGWIPKEWEARACAEVTDNITVGIVIRPAQYYVEDGVPAFRSANIREDGIDPSDLVFISPESNALLAKSQVRRGDVLSVRTGYPGTSAVVLDEFAGANCVDILISRPAEGLNSDFLAAWINSSFGKEQVLRKQGGLAQQHFNVGELRELVVALPEPKEQERIVTRLQAVNSRVQLEVSMSRKYNAIKAGLMQDLLSGRISVAIDSSTEAKEVAENV
jgi:type I restriction enzyme S subunit